MKMCDQGLAAPSAPVPQEQWFLLANSVCVVTLDHWSCGLGLLSPSVGPAAGHGERGDTFLCRHVQLCPPCGHQGPSHRGGVIAEAGVLTGLAGLQSVV